MDSLDRSKLIRKMFVMKVHPGNEAEYKKRHDEIWPELVALLKSHGVHNYCISLLPSTNQLVAYVELESEERWNAISEDPICHKWWKYMDPLMPGEEMANGMRKPSGEECKEMFFLA
jgi:L-rhamnose mutarotase